MSSGLVSRCAALSWARGRAMIPAAALAGTARAGGVEALLASAEDELAEEFKSRDPRPSRPAGPHDTEALRCAAAGLSARGIRVLTAFDEDYPAALAR